MILSKLGSKRLLVSWLYIPTWKDYFNTDINITWFGQVVSLSYCDWNWELQRIPYTPTASTVTRFHWAKIIINPRCSRNLEYCSELMRRRRLLRVTWIEIWSVRITPQATPDFSLVVIRYVQLGYWCPALEHGHSKYLSSRENAFSTEHWLLLKISRKI